MIDTLFFGLQIVVLIAWAVMHDRLEEGDETRGPLALKQPGRVDGSYREKNTGAGLTRHRGRSNLKYRRR